MCRKTGTRRANSAFKAIFLLVTTVLPECVELFFARCSSCLPIGLRLSCERVTLRSFDISSNPEHFFWKLTFTLTTLSDIRATYLQ